MLTADELSGVAEQLLAVYHSQKERLDEIHRYIRDKACDIYVPRGATAEYKLLVEQARSNFLRLVVKSLAQNLFVDGYRPTGDNGRAPSRDNAPIWDEVWQPNRMDARQAAIYRPAISYGWSFATALPGEPVPVITPYSPRRLTALYDDELNDEWPKYAMTIRRHGGAPTSKIVVAGQSRNVVADYGTRLTIFDDEAVYEITKGIKGWELNGEAKVHKLGVCPVVRFLDEWDGDELPEGKVWPLLPQQKQANQTTFGLLMAQQFAAFKQRWIAGMSDEDSDFRARVDAIFRSDSPDTKFGEFGETNLDGYLNSREKLLLFVAAVAQMVPHTLVTSGAISNISAEALAALANAERRDINDHQTTFGESIEQLLRLAGKANGDEEAWADTSAQVVWRDTTPRSLAQTADALGKLAQMLAIPVEALWEMVPGVTDQDIARWRDMRNEADLMGELDQMINGTRGEPLAVASGNGADATAPG